MHILSNKLIATNRKAWHEYQIHEKFEAGIILQGSEVKSLREGKANIKEAYVRFFNNELFIIGMHISEYSHASYSTHKPVHDRKLLLHKKELAKLLRVVDEKGMTLIPLSMYFKNSRAKVEFGVAKGKKQWDKRHDIAKRDAKRDTDRELKKVRTIV
ncbi:MAG: SsrA-binding protein SmpB [Candidatus Marinimicrobia bacterium]|nr:SsrA-binding protein SmpB [Candidatus Neomarinimicrobiota bacterium]MBT4538477.1 SsrA-binding protein SmpB [Candidatus Neomarinimicrobiota bacterium]MBT5211702.1 SsrA-binding protein SmpB [Candidatus Neomarinimicrobiota bacterium]